jgi:hypothetical protein
MANKKDLPMKISNGSKINAGAEYTGRPIAQPATKGGFWKKNQLS